MKLKENIEMKSQRENSTFGFCRHAKCQPEKTKRAIFCQRSTEMKAI